MIQQQNAFDPIHFIRSVIWIILGPMIRNPDYFFDDPAHSCYTRYHLKHSFHQIENCIGSESATINYFQLIKFEVEVDMRDHVLFPPIRFAEIVIWLMHVPSTFTSTKIRQMLATLFGNPCNSQFFKFFRPFSEIF